MIVKAFLKFFLPLCLLLLAFSGMNAAGRQTAADFTSQYSLPSNEFLPLCPVNQECIALPAVSGTDLNHKEHLKIYSEEKEEESCNVLAGKKPVQGFSYFFQSSAFAIQRSSLFEKTLFTLRSPALYTCLDRCIAFRVFRI